ncbi:MAG: cation transporter [Bacteroidales bacterium]|nr:cation transporter [Bacteroidales bacterium]
MGTIYIVAIVINLLFVAAETVAGLIGHSMGLLSDAGHNLSDVFCLLLAMVALKLSHTRATKRFTYGYRKSSILISLLNAIILLVAVGGIVVESIHKFSHPAPVNGLLVTWTAAAAIVVNGFTAWMLSRKQHDINTRGAFLHMLADTLVSAGVVVSGIVITHTGWTVIDPIIGLVIAVVILVSTWQLLAESLRMSVDAVPEGIDPDSIADMMRRTDGVLDVHHIHIWPISTTETALTAHIVIADITLLDDTTHAIKTMLATQGIAHSTLELETTASHCDRHGC